MENNFKKLSESIIKHLGGEKNIKTISHCATKLRIVLKNSKIAKTWYIKSLKEVLDVVEKESIHIVLGLEITTLFFDYFVKQNKIRKTKIVRFDEDLEKVKATTKNLKEKKSLVSKNKSLKIDLPQEINYVFEMKDITKTFLNGSIVANDKVNISVEKNTIHSICGGNGAGKSVLMSILFGLYKPDYGFIKIDNKNVSINNPKDAEELGIGFVPQHPELVENLSVIENLIVGQEIDKNMIFGSRINWKLVNRKFDEVNKKFKFNLDPKARVKDLPISSKQKVQIMRSLWNDKRILILDEPTSILSPLEIEAFIDLVKLFREFGRTVIFISHKLDEVLQVSDRITILRNGKSIDTFENNDKLSISKLSTLIVGDKNFKFDLKKSKVKEETKLTVKNLSTNFKNDKNIKNINFSVRAGEIYGIASIDGNGEQELLEAIVGIRKHTGDVSIPELEKEKQIYDKDLQNVRSNLKQKLETFKQSLSAAKSTSSTNVDSLLKVKELKEKINQIKSDLRRYSGISKLFYKIKDNTNKRLRYISYLPSDRQDESIIMDNNLIENAISDINLKDPLYSRNGIIKWKSAAEKARNIVSKNDVKGAEDIDQIIRNLSGGNQQKFAIGRQLEREYEILVLGQPTRGVDIGAINQIYKKVKNIANEGKAIVVQSYELEELLNHCNKIGIMHEGKLVAEFIPGELSNTHISEYMLLGRRT